MSVAEDFQERLSQQAKELLAQYVAECISAGRVPDVVWQGELKVLRKTWLGMRWRTEPRKLAGWLIPRIESKKHWILEDGGWCWENHYIHFTFGRRTHETDELEYMNVSDLSLETLRAIIMALQVHFREIAPST